MSFGSGQATYSPGTPPTTLPGAKGKVLGPVSTNLGTPMQPSQLPGMKGDLLGSNIGTATANNVPTYQPAGVNNQPFNPNPVQPVPNNPQNRIDNDNNQSPYNMDFNRFSNGMQNNNTDNMHDYNPRLPTNPNQLVQGGPKQWYPGMYPSTSQQFGTNPYSPQTFNIQGHPGHNPSSVASVEPNVANTALSNHGQFQMAGLPNIRR